MTHAIDELCLNRPRLLVRAAQSGQCIYNRKRHLRRILRISFLPSYRGAIDRLLEAEAAVDEQRKTGNATYRAARHVELLIAILAEYKAAAQDAQGPT
jgi:hypothetical protein